MSLPPRTPTDPASSHRAIENLIATYAELVDDGDFAELGGLFTHASFIGSGAPVSGCEAVRKMFEETLIVHADGTPRTQHVTTNLTITVDEQAGTALARSYVTVLQSLPDLPLQPIAAGRYRDSFERHDRRWRFAERHVRINLVGDVSQHLRQANAKD